MRKNDWAVRLDIIISKCNLVPSFRPLLYVVTIEPWQPMNLYGPSEPWIQLCSFVPSITCHNRPVKQRESSRPDIGQTRWPYHKHSCTQEQTHTHFTYICIYLKNQSHEQYSNKTLDKIPCVWNLKYHLWHVKLISTKNPIILTDMVQIIPSDTDTATQIYCGATHILEINSWATKISKSISQPNCNNQLLKT